MFISLFYKKDGLNNSSGNLEISLDYYTQYKDRFKRSLAHKQVRMYSTSSNNDSSVDNPNLVVFSNADKDKLEILNYVKGKSGIYM